jgi:hypothetical protein
MAFDKPNRDGWLYDSSRHRLQPHRASGRKLRKIIQAESQQQPTPKEMSEAIAFKGV